MLKNVQAAVKDRNSRDKKLDQNLSFFFINLRFVKLINLGLLLKSGPGLWTQTLKNLDSEKAGPRKTWILRKLDPKMEM